MGADTQRGGGIGRGALGILDAQQRRLVEPSQRFQPARELGLGDGVGGLEIQVTTVEAGRARVPGGAIARRAQEAGGGLVAIALAEGALAEQGAGLGSRLRQAAQAGEAHLPVAAIAQEDALDLEQPIRNLAPFRGLLDGVEQGRGVHGRIVAAPAPRRQPAAGEKGEMGEGIAAAGG